MTPKQRELLDAIRTLTEDGVAPSYEELRLFCGLSSKGEVHRMVTALQNAGWLTGCGRARGLMATTPAPLEKMSREALLALRAQIDRRLAA